MVASTWLICAVTMRSSSRNRTLLASTKSPSLKATSMICPSTRGLTATLASGSTVPGANRITGMSASTTSATVTGARAAPPPRLPSPLVSLLAALASPLAVEARLFSKVLAAVIRSGQKKYAADTAMAAPAMYSASRLGFMSLTNRQPTSGPFGPGFDASQLPLYAGRMPGASARPSSDTAPPTPNAARLVNPSHPLTTLARRPSAGRAIITQT